MEGMHEADDPDVRTVPGAPVSSSPDPNDFHRTQDVGFLEAAVTTMDPPGDGFRTMYFGFGFEGIISQAERDDLMARALDFLLS